MLNFCKTIKEIKFIEGDFTGIHLTSSKAFDFKGNHYIPLTSSLIVTTINLLWRINTKSKSFKTYLKLHLIFGILNSIIYSSSLVEIILVIYFLISVTIAHDYHSWLIQYRAADYSTLFHPPTQWQMCTRHTSQFVTVVLEKTSPDTVYH